MTSTASRGAVRIIENSAQFRKTTLNDANQINGNDSEIALPSLSLNLSLSGRFAVTPDYAVTRKRFSRPSNGHEQPQALLLGHLEEYFPSPQHRPMVLKSTAMNRNRGLRNRRKIPSRPSNTAKRANRASSMAANRSRQTLTASKLQLRPMSRPKSFRLQRAGT